MDSLLCEAFNVAFTGSKAYQAFNEFKSGNLLLYFWNEFEPGYLFRCIFGQKKFQTPT